MWLLLYSNVARYNNHESCLLVEREQFVVSLEPWVVFVQSSSILNPCTLPMQSTESLCIRHIKYTADVTLSGYVLFWRSVAKDVLFWIE